MQLHKLKVINPNNAVSIGSKVFVDDVEIKAVRSVTYEVAANMAPTATIETYTDPNFEADCGIRIIVKAPSETEGSLDNPYVRYNAKYPVLFKNIVDVLHEELGEDDERCESLADKIIERISEK